MNGKCPFGRRAKDRRTVNPSYKILGAYFYQIFQSWHVEHFVCHHCEKPFLNDTYFVGADDGKPYCEYHYNKLFGDSCTWCGRVIQSQVTFQLYRCS